jgi:hypothetical protein
VQQSDSAIHYPAMHAQPRAVRHATAGDHRSDLKRADPVAVALAIRGAVGVDPTRTGRIPRAVAT